MAAWLGLWVGASWATQLTHIIRPLLFAVLAISIAPLVYRFVAARVRA